MTERASRTRRLVLVRHAESEANAGRPCADPRSSPLTELGLRQAERVARGWREAPGLIVTSPFVRARRTADATARRFPDVPSQVWPVGEFLYLSGPPALLASPAGRRPLADAYWRRADPAHRDGPGAESFHGLLDRASRFLDQAAGLPGAAVTAVFTHELFIRAVLWRILLPDRPVGPEAMTDFHGWRRSLPLGNTGVVQIAVHQQFGVRLESVGEGGAGVEAP
ncbi:histidine phosphatase family protein [Streptomyces scabiei]|uniref:histidine phosphatase family protein n=1 Tax=Streptomyces scabiei TaxID=1930 RepID=UPI0029A23962|nr:histidine phosphatase family protein [Streptomyces scabiei]MDX3114133.1 phosphoglycerate mutase family protein [Streptomyces scabiei]